MTTKVRIALTWRNRFRLHLQLFAYRHGWRWLWHCCRAIPWTHKRQMETTDERL